MDNSAATLTITNTVAFGGLDGSNNSLGILQVHQGTVQVNGGMLTNTNEINVGDTLGYTGALTFVQRHRERAACRKHPQRQL